VELKSPRYGLVDALVRFDERDNVQARYGLVPGSADYEDYYRPHPELRGVDDEIRALPGVGRVGHALDLPFLTKQLEFIIRNSAEKLVDGPVAAERHELSPERAAEKVKGYALQLGADLVRIGPLNPAWVYTNVGKTWHDPDRHFGDPIDLGHKHAISIAVGIDRGLIRTGPVLPMIIDVMRGYAELCVIATMLAAYIRGLGYPARAHVLANYQVLCVPIAIDAGMGELGRHGLMITKELGSCLKLATVTTDLPVAYDRPVDIGVQEFCEDCKLCAETCPSGAISQGKRKVVRGVEKWCINAEACYSVWNETGTDCGVCLASCPWTKPRTPFHRLAVEIASRKRHAGKWMSWADRVVYGKFSPEPPPGWFEIPPEIWRKYSRLV
jgi:ferredoxin